MKTVDLLILTLAAIFFATVAKANDLPKMAEEYFYCDVATEIGYMSASDIQTCGKTYICSNSGSSV